MKFQTRDFMRKGTSYKWITWLDLNEQMYLECGPLEDSVNIVIQRPGLMKL